MAAEKAQLLEARFAVRRQAEAQKKEMMEKVEQMKKKGNITKDDLAKLGLDQDDNQSVDYNS